VKLEICAQLKIKWCSKKLQGRCLAQEKKYCLPNTIEAYQVAKIYSKYLEEHPEKLHQNSNITFSEALIAYFPCKN